jgi:prepilin-type N-terminal cleavage/methylation domain-containing protein
MLRTKLEQGFTIVELLVVILVIGAIASYVVFILPGSRDRANYSRAESELRSMGNAVKFYVDKYDEYPADVSRDLPAGIEEFVQAEEGWPDAPWPNSVYDYDYFDNNGETVQISIRFCPIGGPLSACKFPREPWAEGFQVNSSVYYCIKGQCRAHPSEADDYPGYCINCTFNEED